MQELFQHKGDCCGCGACAAACPEDAIVMTADEEGFFYPVTDPLYCVDCGACTQVCPVSGSEPLKNSSRQTLFRFVHTDEQVLKASTSAGAFTAISDYVLSLGGAVYGADFDESFRVFHSRAITPEKRDCQRISKYAQSDIRGVFSQVEADLSRGQVVLFTGTPCQVAGLKAVIPQSLRKNLYLCDLICHSIPSPLIWQAFLDYQQNLHGGRVTKVMFRSKRYPWTRENSNRGLQFEIDGRLYEDNSFYDLFFKVGTICRPSCEYCRFTSRKRVGDVTIGDYWGIEEFSPENYNPLGVSMVLANNPTGEHLCRQMQRTGHMQKREIAEQEKHQKRLREPVKYPEYRDTFWQDFLNYGMEYVINTYTE